MARSEARSTGSITGIGGAYEVVSLRPSWGSIAVLLFMCALFSRPFFQVLPWRPGDPAIWWMARAVTPLLIALLGLGSGLIGMRFAPNKTTARAGVFLNGIVIALIFFLIAAFYVYRYWR